MDDPFLPAIQAHPEDDGVRLVYADWLEERGDADAQARAALIRAQCELVRLPIHDARRTPLQQEAPQLLKTHGRRWTQPLRKAKLTSRLQFRRGFLEAATLSAEEFVCVAADLFRLAPSLCAFRFPDASNEVSALAASPYLARAIEIDLSQMCGCGRCLIERELRELFASPHAVSLRVLKLAGNRLDVRGAGHLAESPHLTRLTTLDLADNPVGGGARHLAESWTLSNLTTLVLRGAGIGAASVRMLVNSPTLAHLRELDLAGNAFGDVGARALLKSAQLDGLTRLDVRNCGIGREARKALQERFGDRVIVAPRRRDSAVPPRPQGFALG